MSSLLGLALVWVGDSLSGTGLGILTGTLFVLTGLIVPVLLACWTTIMLREFPISRGAGISGVAGLLLICLRSILWGLDVLLSDGVDFFLIAGMAMYVLSVVGSSLWLFWLIRLSLWLISQGRKREIGAKLSHQASRRHSVRERRTFLTVGTNLAIGLLGGTFVLARAGLLVTGEPARESDDVPAVPSFAASLFYFAALAVTRLFPELTSNAQAQNVNPPMQKRQAALPVGTSLEEVDALGVPSELITAPRADRSRVILYLHGGGWQEHLHDSQRVLASQLSAATGVCVLVPDYRVGPLHPFPASLQDCVSAYRWLRSLGIATERIVVFGESVGGHFVLTASLLLRERGEALPAALVSLYPGTDLTQSGETWYAKDNVSIIVRRESGKREIAAYVGEQDVRNPLISPLFADVSGLPPTLLQVGTQDVLLSDSIRMADHLRRASVQTKLEVWPGMWHGWHFESDFVPEARLAIEHIARFIRGHLMKR